MAITKATASAVAPAAKGDLVVGSATNDAAVLSVGSANQVLTVDSSTTTGLKWATPVQPKVFNFLGLAANQSFYGIAWNGSNIYVATAFSGVLWSSTDSGVTWTARTSGFGTNNIYNVAYGNGLFVAVGGNGTITTSTDGITWTARTSGVSTNILYNVAYVNNNWIAVGAGANGGTGGITTSSDGITWTKRNTPTTSSTELYNIAYGNGYYVVFGDTNTRNGYYSTNLTSWSVNGSGISVQSNGAFFYNGTFFSYSGAGSGFYATDPSATWTSISNSNAAIYQPAGPGLFGVYNGKLYYVNNFVQDAIYGWTLTLSGGRLTERLQPIPLGVSVSGSGTGDKNSFIRSFLVNSDGSMLYTDDAGRIYKAS